METALVEAKKAIGRTRPNPVVGCVIVHRNKIVGLGHHVRAGSPHAEVVALAQAGKAARNADAYVTLEPCNHQGQTGPCTEALLKAGIKRVFVGVKDPNPLVNGKGIRRLRRAGMVVYVGLLEQECRETNEAYETTMRKGRPLIVAKFAQSLDGRVATALGESQWISGKPARMIGHQLRNELDGIVVGVQTVISDNPKLTCRIRGGRDPVRIVLDTHGKTPLDANVIQQQSQAPAWIAMANSVSKEKQKLFERAGAKVLLCKCIKKHIDLNDLVKQLKDLGLLSVLIEGGPTVLGGFFDATLVDKVVAFVAPIIIGGTQARSSIAGRGVMHLDDAFLLHNQKLQWVGKDLMVTGNLV